MSKYPGRIVSNLAPAGYSVFFDGTGDYLTGPTNTATAFNLTGNFTIECWAYFNSVATSFAGLVSWADSSGWNGWQFLNNAGTLTFEFLTGSAGAGTTTSSAGALTTGRWFHLAAVRSGSTITLYINGVSSGTPVTYSSSQTSSSSFIKVAADRLATALTTGYISNVRVVNGTALYTAAFTPPTQLFNITNTSLLTCNSPAIIDQSNNAFAITVNGNSVASTFTPFTAYVPYNPALGASTPGIWTVDEAMQAAATRQWNMYDPYFNLNTLLLHGNGTNTAQNNQFLDSSSNNFTITRNPVSGPNAPTQGSFSPFSQTGWSTFFDGSGDSFSVSTSTVLDLNGAIDFTIEAWVYLTGYGSTSDMSLNIANKFTGAGGLGYTYGIFGGGANQGKIQFYGAAGSVSIISTNVIPLNSWNHVAIVKSGTTYTHYLNGVANGSQTTATTLTASANALVIGDYGYADDFLGYMSNLRITKNGAVYTSGFTPPTSPLTTSVSAGTVSLLTFQSNRFVDNSSNGFTLTPSGTPSVQAFSPFYPTAAYTPQTIGGSGFFDGTGDYIFTASNTALVLSTGSWTIEAFAYLTGGSGYRTVLSKRTGGTAEYEMGVDPSGFFYLYIGSTVYATSTAVPLNSWNHLCITSDGTNIRMFQNGVLTRYNASLSPGSGTGNLATGVEAGTVAQSWIGYISNERIVKGSVVSVYATSSTTTGTQIFTPPTAPLTAITNTSYLLNFTNAGVVDSTGKNVLETVGNAQISTAVSRFGGSSMAFDGTGDYLVTPSSPVNILGSGDFTVELWAYPSNISAGYRALVASENYNGTTGGWSIYQNGTAIEVWLTGSGSPLINATSSLTATTWQHIALSRASGTVRLFVNGISVGSASSSAEWTGQRIFIGDNNVSGTDYFFNGYIDDLRITKGFARYTAAFTPQTSQWQDQ